METKEKITLELENKSVVEELADRYVTAETELLSELSKLKNFSSPCNCDKKIRKIIRTIFEGGHPEISTYCIKCGGHSEE